jgi:hypothetical protein
MRLNSFQLIKSCSTRPDIYRDVPAAETKSIGLRADARVSWFLQTPPRLFYRDQTAIVHLSGLGTVKTVSS